MSPTPKDDEAPPRWPMTSKSLSSAHARTFFLLFTVLTIGILTAGTAAAAAPAPSANASPALTGAPSLTGSKSTYLVGNGSALVFVGAESWTNQWNAVSNGSQVYSDALILIAFDLKATNILLTVNAWQDGHGWVSNQSALMAPLTQTVITVPFVSDASWRSIVVKMDGTPFYGQIATPISLLPPGILNIGGLDLLALGIISEGVICFASVMALAKVLQKRARYAPKFSLLIWGPVVLVGIAAAVIFDYQAVNAYFAGWSPLVYAFAVTPMMFLFSLSLFNRAEKAELLQRVAKPQGKILYRRWLLRFSTLPDGRTVLIDERWRGWLARLFGHHVVIDKGDELTPVYYEGETQLMKSPTPSKGTVKVTDRFKVSNPQEDEVARIWWTDTGDPVMVKWPRITIHRLRTIHAKTSPEGTVIRAEFTKPVLSLPHYTEPEVELRRALEDYKAVEAVSAEWANTRDPARVLSKVKTDLYVLKAGFSAQVEAEVESRLTAYYSLIGRTTADLSDEEAKNAAKKGETAPSLAELLDESRLRASNKPTPKRGTG